MFGKPKPPTEEMIALRAAEDDAGALKLALCYMEKTNKSLEKYDPDFLLQTALLYLELDENELKAIPQASNVAGVYKRRKNNQLDFEALELNQIYDFIRMLDGNNYPKAHLNLGKYKLEFSRASYDLEKILCDVKIIENI